MQTLLEALERDARNRPHAVALTDGRESISCRDLSTAINRAAEALDKLGPSAIALNTDNSPAWVIADLAAACCGIPLVPIPPFFSDAQVAHVLDKAPIDLLLGDKTGAENGLDNTAMAVPIAGLEVQRLTRSASAAALPDGCVKVTFTSGSTGTPRGVCLSRELLDTVVLRLCDLFDDLNIARHLCSMPLAALLENVAGVYVPLALGASVAAPPLAELGLYGSSRSDGRRFLRMIESTDAESLILLPQVLRELIDAVVASGARTPLRYVAVGGARVAAADLAAARAAAIPAYQGYGLSECGSVVALNRPGSGHDDSVGKPLPGVDIRIAHDGEICVRNQCMSAYLDDVAAPAEIATGDLGRLDGDGNLYVTGRKKDVFITSFGRNVSPEWPEAELLHETGLLQACVFGEARPKNIAILVIDTSSLRPDDIATVIARVNLRLPDYARIGEWIVADEPFTPVNGLLTPNGKISRQKIADRYVFDRTASVASAI